MYSECTDTSSCEELRPEVYSYSLSQPPPTPEIILDNPPAGQSELYPHDLLQRPTTKTIKTMPTIPQCPPATPERYQIPTPPPPVNHQPKKERVCRTAVIMKVPAEHCNIGPPQDRPAGAGNASSSERCVGYLGKPQYEISMATCPASQVAPAYRRCLYNRITHKADDMAARNNNMRQSQNAECIQSSAKKLVRQMLYALQESDNNVFCEVNEPVHGAGLLSHQMKQNTQSQYRQSEQSRPHAHKTSKGLGKSKRQHQQRSTQRIEETSHPEKSLTQSAPQTDPVVEMSKYFIKPTIEEMKIVGISAKFPIEPLKSKTRSSNLSGTTDHQSLSLPQQQLKAPAEQNRLTQSDVVYKTPILQEQNERPNHSDEAQMKQSNRTQVQVVKQLDVRPVKQQAESNAKSATKPRKQTKAPSLPEQQQQVIYPYNDNTIAHGQLETEIAKIKPLDDAESQPLAVKPTTNTPSLSDQQQKRQHKVMYSTDEAKKRHEPLATEITPMHCQNMEEKIEILPSEPLVEPEQAVSSDQTTTSQSDRGKSKQSEETARQIKTILSIPSQQFTKSKSNRQPKKKMTQQNTQWLEVPGAKHNKGSNHHTNQPDQSVDISPKQQENSSSLLTYKSQTSPVKQATVKPTAKLSHKSDIEASHLTNAPIIVITPSDENTSQVKQTNQVSNLLKSTDKGIKQAEPSDKHSAKSKLSTDEQYKHDCVPDQQWDIAMQEPIQSSDETTAESTEFVQSSQKPPIQSEAPAINTATVSQKAEAPASQQPSTAQKAIHKKGRCTRFMQSVLCRRTSDPHSTRDQQTETDPIASTNESRQSVGQVARNPTMPPTIASESRQSVGQVARNATMPPVMAHHDDSRPLGPATGSATNKGSNHLSPKIATSPIRKGSKVGNQSSRPLLKLPSAVTGSKSRRGEQHIQSATTWGPGETAGNSSAGQPEKPPAPLKTYSQSSRVSGTLSQPNMTRKKELGITTDRSIMSDKSGNKLVQSTTEKQPSGIVIPIDASSQQQQVVKTNYAKLSRENSQQNIAAIPAITSQLETGSGNVTLDEDQSKRGAGTNGDNGISKDEHNGNNTDNDVPDDGPVDADTFASTNDVTGEQTVTQVINDDEITKDTMQATTDDVGTNEARRHASVKDFVATDAISTVDRLISDTNAIDATLNATDTDAQKKTANDDGYTSKRIPSDEHIKTTITTTNDPSKNISSAKDINTTTSTADDTSKTITSENDTIIVTTSANEDVPSKNTTIAEDMKTTISTKDDHSKAEKDTKTFTSRKYNPKSTNTANGTRTTNTTKDKKIIDVTKTTITLNDPNTHDTITNDAKPNKPAKRNSITNGTTGTVNPDKTNVTTKADDKTAQVKKRTASPFETKRTPEIEKKKVDDHRTKPSAQKTIQNEEVKKNISGEAMNDKLHRHRNRTAEDKRQSFGHQKSSRRMVKDVVERLTKFSNVEARQPHSVEYLGIKALNPAVWQERQDTNVHQCDPTDDEGPVCAYEFPKSRKSLLSDACSTQKKRNVTECCHNDFIQRRNCDVLYKSK